MHPTGYIAALGAITPRSFSGGEFHCFAMGKAACQALRCVLKGLRPARHIFRRMQTSESGTDRRNFALIPPPVGATVNPTRSAHIGRCPSRPHSRFAAQR